MNTVEYYVVWVVLISANILYYRWLHKWMNK